MYSMKISVKNVKGNTIYTDTVLPTDSVKSIKVRIADETCHAPGDLILIVHGKQLEDGHTLADYNIGDGSTLHCLVRPETGMKISVKNVKGNTIYTDTVLPTDSVKSIKVRIADETCHAPGDLILIVHGKQLEDGHTLADYNIGDGSTLHCLVRPETDKSLDEKETKTDKLPDEVNRDREESPEQSLPKSKPCMSQGTIQGQDSRFTDTFKKPDDESVPETRHVVDDSRTDGGNDKSLDEKETKTDKLPDEVNRDREESPEQSLPKSKPCMSQGTIRGQDSRLTDTFKKPDDESVPETRHVVDDSRTDGGNEVHSVLVAEKPIPKPRTKKTKPIVQDTVTAEAQCDESDVAAGTEAELSVSAGSSVEIIPEDEGDQEITDVVTNFPLLSLPYGSMIPKCPSISDSVSITDKFKENESNSSTIPRYTLQKVGNKYLLHVTGKSKPKLFPQLNGKSNVSVEKEYILIDDEFAYCIGEDGNGKITLDAFNEYTNAKESRPNTAMQASALGADNQTKVGHLAEKEIVVDAAQKTESMRLSANAERDKMQHHKISRTVATALANDNQTVVDQIHNKTIGEALQEVDVVELEAKMNNSGQDKIHTGAKHKTSLFPKDNKDTCIIDGDDRSSSNPGSRNDTDSESDKNSLTAEGKQGMDQLVDAFHVFNIKSVGNGGKISSKLEGARSLSQYMTGTRPTSEPETCRRASTQPQIRASTQPQSSSQKEKPVIHARGRDDHTLSSEMSGLPARLETEVSAEGISEIPVVSPRWEAEVSSNGISEIPVVPPRREAEVSSKGISEIPVVPPRQGRRSRKHHVSVRVYHGKQSNFYNVDPQSTESYMKWQFLLYNQETVNQLNLKGLKVENNCIVIKVAEDVKENTLAKILEQALCSIPLYVGQFRLNNYVPEIEKVLMSCEFVKQKLMYTEYIQEDKIYAFVCRTELQERAEQEYANALKLVTTGNREIVTENFQCPMGFDFVCDCYDVQTLISSRFPNVQIQCLTNYSKRTCDCSLSGRDIAILDEVKRFLQTEVVDKYPCNSIAFSDIRHLDCMNAGSVGMFVETELKILILETSCPDDMHFQINKEAKRIVVVGTSQNNVDHVCSRVKSCIAYKEFELDTSDEEMQKNISDIQSEYTGRIFLSVDGNKCHCMGSTEVVKKLENRLRPQTADGEKRRNKNEPQDLSLKPYLPKKDLQQVMKTRTIKVRSSNMLKVIQKSISVGDIEITPIEKNGRFGFQIVGHDDDLIVATERKIQSLQEEINEEQITVGVSDEQLEHYETVISRTEQHCNVIINTLKLKQNKRKEEELTHETKSGSKEWICNGGQTLRLSYGQAQDCWKDLLIELKWQYSGRECCSIVKNVGKKKCTELFLPQWTDDGGKCTHIVQDAIKTLLLQAKDDCTHVCISLDERFGWSIRHVTKQILKSVRTVYLDIVIPVEFEMCLSDFEDFKECRKIIGETMPCGDSDNDSDEGQSLDKGNEDNQQRLKQIKITVIKGQLNNMKADVLVNTTAPNLDLHCGAVSQSLIRKAGDEMQQECKRKYPNGIKIGEIAFTNGYKLNCKHVLHGALKQYDKENGDYTLSTLEKFVMNCLKKASSLGHRSIAFPAIGTGNLGYPAEKVAEVMFNCVRMFDEQLKSPKQVEDVRFVVYEKDQNVVNAFEKRKGMFEKGDGKIPRKPELPTSRQIRCCGITIDAQIGSLHTCDADALLYFWDSTSLYSVSTKHPLLQQLGKDVSADFFKKRQPSVFSTEGGKLGNHRVLHIPVKNSSKALMQGFRDGVRQADIEECCSAAVYFDTTSPFLVHQDQLAKELIEAVKDYGARFKHLHHVTLVAEGMHNSGKIFQAFENDQEIVEEVSSPMKTSIRMHMNITGCDRDIEKAKQLLTNWPLSSKKLDSNDVTDTSVSGACAAVNAPGPQSMNRTASPVMVTSEQVEVVHLPPDIEPYLSKMDCLQGYVLVSNIPPDYSYDELGRKLLCSGLPCSSKDLIYLKGTGKAVLVCNTSEDANKLSGYIGADPFVFTCLERQVLGRFDFCIDKKDVERIKQQGQFDNFQKGLNELNATFKQNFHLEIQVETSYQLSCVGELKTRCMSAGTGSHCTVASKADDFEHVVVSKVSIDDVSLKVWEVMKIEKQEAIQTFNDTCGYINYADHTLTIRRNENTSVEGRFDDYVKDFKSFVKHLKTMEFEDVPVDKKFVQDISVWTAEIDKRMEIKCCTFSASLGKVIVYCGAYQDVCKVKHYFLVKQNKIKTTGRRRNPTQDTGECRQSLQPGYTVNTDKQSTDIIFQRPQNFEWIRDATNVETFKTSEGIQVYVYEANILNLPVDCIVNAANDALHHGGGVAEVIAKNAGQDLVKEGFAYIKKHGKLAVGHAMSTTAGKLAYKHVIHAVGPRWSDYSPHSSQEVSTCELHLSNAIYNSILEAKKLKLKSIALPAISSAIFGVPEDLCVCMYVEATLKYSKDHTNFPVADIHFIDKNSRIISLLQHEFKMVLNKGGISPYHAKSHSGSQRPRHRRTNFWEEQSSCDLSSTEVPTNVRDVSLGKIIPTHECLFGKDNFRFCGRTDMSLLVYKGDVLAYSNSAVVVTIDEKLNAGSIAMGVRQKIPAQLQKEYQSKLKDQLPPGRSVGHITITEGFGSPFNSIIHVVFPTSARLKDATERRACLLTVYSSIFNGVAKRTDANVITTTLIGIDEDNKNDVNMCAEAFLQGYISFVEETLLQRSAPFDVRLICRNDKNVQRICYLFKTYVTEQQHLHMKSKESSVSHARDAPEGQHDSFKPMPMVDVDDEDSPSCVICMDSITMPKQLKCGHKFCTECIDMQFKFKKTCPTCGAVCGVITGDQPVGYINVRSNDWPHCSGYADCGQILITYTFPDGRQQDNHPNPGNRYKGISRTAYLPNNREGRQIRDMLKVAFDRKLVFTIGSSRTTGQEGVITWNDIHHKTDPRSHTQFGYPDKTYLSRVKGELADKGVTVEDIPK